MVMKCDKKKSDDLSYWNVKKSFSNNEIENLDDDERSITFSVNLLLKNRNISQPNLVRLPSHLITSTNCQCHRSFHIFCTEFFNENYENFQMINIHPAPRNHDRDSIRRISTGIKRNVRRNQDDNEKEILDTTRSEPLPGILSENQIFEKKVRIHRKLPTRTTSFNISPPTSYDSVQRSIPFPLKYSPSIRTVKNSPMSTQLQIYASSIFDQSPSTSQLLFPRGPPPSPNTPTVETSTIIINSTLAAPLRAIPMIPRLRNSNQNEKKLINASIMKTNYEDHARAYLSASDFSDNDEENDDKDLDNLLTITKPKSPRRSQSLLKQDSTFRDRFLPNKVNRNLSLAEVYYSPLDVYKNLAGKFHRHPKSQTRLAITNENDDSATILTKTIKTMPMSQSRSVFGFSKTASSMHFGHAAGRLSLQGSFEKWPQPQSRRTPIERKQEVTTLRLVTLPLVTS